MADPLRSAPCRRANGTKIRDRSSRPASERIHSLSVTRMPRTACRSAQLVGEERIIWASDYPHFDAETDCVATLTKRTDLSESAKRKILGENAARLYNLPY